MEKLRPGRQAEQLDQYRHKCLQSIADLERRMQAIGDIRDAQYKKLRCQKFSYQKRLRDRMKSKSVSDQLQLSEAIIELLSSESLKQIPDASKREELQARLRREKNKRYLSFLPKSKHLY